MTKMMSQEEIEKLEKIVTELENILPNLQTNAITTYNYINEVKYTLIRANTLLTQIRNRIGNEK